MSRLARLPRDQLGADQAEVYDAIASGPRASGPFRLVESDGSLTGPFGPMLLAPAVGSALASLGEAIRYRSSLSSRTREIAILAVGALRRNGYEWYAHERVGRAIGMTDDEIETIKRGAVPDDGADERDVVAAARSIASGEGVPEDLYQRLVGSLGLNGTMELVTLVGYYTTLAMVMEVFDISVPDGEDEPF
jgi:4-carboxymuconolactone decarboxylase